MQPPSDYDTEWWLMDSATGEIVESGVDERGLYWMAASRDGSRLLLQHADGVEVVDRGTGETHRLDIQDVGRPVLLLSPDGTRLLHENRLLGVETGEVVLRFDLGERGENCLSIAPSFSSDASLVMFGCEDSLLHVYSTRSGERVGTLVGHSGWAVAGGFDRTNRLGASGSADGFIRLWDLSLQREVKTINLDTGYKADAGLDVSGGIGVALAYPSESESLFDNFRSYMERPAIGGLQLFDLDGGNSPARVDGVGGKVARLSPDGALVAAQIATEEGIGNVRIFGAATGDLLYELPGLCRFRPGGDLSHCGELIAADATDIAWSPDGRFLAVAGGVSQKAIVWDTTTRRIEFVSDLARLEPFSSIAYSRDGSLLAVSSKSAMWIYDTSTWELATDPVGHVGRPSWVMEFLSDGTELITAQAHSGDVRIYDTTTWEERNILGGSAQTRDMAISQDETMVALADLEGSIHVLDLATGDLLELISLDDRDITNIEFIDEDRHLLITSSTGPVEILTLDPKELAGIAQSRIS